MQTYIENIITIALFQTKNRMKLMFIRKKICFMEYYTTAKGKNYIYKVIDKIYGHI